MLKMSKKLCAFFMVLAVAAASLPVVTFSAAATGGIIFDDTFDAAFDKAANGYGGNGPWDCENGYLQIDTDLGNAFVVKEFAPQSSGIIGLEMEFEFERVAAPNANYNFPALLTSDGQEFFVEGFSTGKWSNYTVTAGARYKWLLYIYMTPDSKSRRVERYLFDITDPSAPALCGHYLDLGFSAEPADFGRIHLLLSGAGQTLNIYRFKAYLAGTPVAGALYDNEFTSPEETRAEHPVSSWQVSNFNDKPYIQGGKVVLPLYNGNINGAWGYRPLLLPGNAAIAAPDKTTLEVEFAFDGAVEPVTRFATLTDNPYGAQHPSRFEITPEGVLKVGVGWAETVAQLYPGVNYKLTLELDFINKTQAVTLIDLDTETVAGSVTGNFNNPAYSQESGFNYVIFYGETQPSAPPQSPSALVIDAVRIYETPSAFVPSDDVTVLDGGVTYPSEGKAALGITVKNNFAAAKSGIVVMALTQNTNNGGLLIAVKTADFADLASDTASEEISGVFDLPDGAELSDLTFHIFVWDAFDGMNPLNGGKTAIALPNATS
ncbi:MAG: hypothetical protein LBH54_00665 [Clostridiales bacterium]|jgi:hypothetical protein|nr:hypothetical protein [Clostridiales bacterium]